MKFTTEAGRSSLSVALTNELTSQNASLHQQLPLFWVEEYDDILDKEEKPKRVSYINWMFSFAIVMFAYWYIGGFMQWPYAGMGLLLGLVLLLVVMIARFVETPSKKLHNYLYFAGKISLICAIYLYLMHGPYAMWFIWGAFGFFAGGIVFLSFKSR